MSSATPADVLARRSQLILNGDADGFAALFAPDSQLCVTKLSGLVRWSKNNRRVLADPFCGRVPQQVLHPRIPRLYDAIQINKEERVIFELFDLLEIEIGLVLQFDATILRLVPAAL